MYICICKQITDKQIINALENGADLSELQQTLGLTLACGSCLDCVNEIIAEYSVPINHIKIINSAIPAPDQLNKNI